MSTYVNLSRATLTSRAHTHTHNAPKAAFRFRRVKRKEEIQERNNNGDPKCLLLFGSSSLTEARVSCGELSAIKHLHIHSFMFLSLFYVYAPHANSLSVLPNQQQEIAADTLKENDLDPEKDEKQLQELIKVIKDTVNAEKKRIREEKAAWKAKIDGIGAEKKKALDELKIWKYYPQNEYPDVSGNKVRTSFLFALRP